MITINKTKKDIIENITDYNTNIHAFRINYFYTLIEFGNLKHMLRSKVIKNYIAQVTRKKYNKLFNLNINTDYDYYMTDSEVKTLINCLADLLGINKNISSSSLKYLKRDYNFMNEIKYN